MKKILPALLGWSIALLFIFIIFKFSPLGLALVITGACLATLPWTYKDRASYVVGNLGSLLYPIGIILTFIQDGWILGILSIIIGFIAYDYARR